MEYPLTRRHPQTPTPPSPRLVRSRSGSENNSIFGTNTSQTFTRTRSKSTTRSRKGNTINYPLSSTAQKKSITSQDNYSKDGYVRFLQRGSPRDSPAAATKRPRSASQSPSAWALSPGRSSNLFNMLPLESPTVSGGDRKGKAKSGGGGAMSGVLKYFRQKKVSSVQEEENHRFRVLHTRLFQWRFANARAEDSMGSVSRVAEDRVFHVWLRIFNVTKTILEKRVQIQKLKHEIKLHQTINPQMILLNDWAKVEKKNCEAVGRMTGKLSALSVKLPLAEGATGDVESICKAMSTATEIMDSIQVTITKFLTQVENVLYLLTELTSTLESQKESLPEIERLLTLASELLVWEESTKIQFMQVKESRSQEDT